MMKLLKQSGLLMLALLVGSSTVFAAKEAQGVLRVEDKAKLFSAEGIKKAEDKFHDATFKAKTHWTVVTMNDVPASKKADLEAIGKTEKDKAIRFFGELATSMAKERNEVGVFTLVYTNGEKLIVKTVSDKASDLHRHFTDADATTLSDKLLDAIRAGKKKSGDEAVTERDGGLMAGTSFVIDQLKDTSLPEAKKTAGTISKANNDVKASTGMSIGNWICIGLVAALSIWVVIALIRALTNRGGGGYGGGGYGGGGYGGGGGGMGFFGSFMTGMLGAAAGMWMYNNVFGGNHYGNDMSAGGTGDNYGSGDTGGVDTGEGNFDGGADGGGGDWGGDAGGGDAGGGGDWGGDTGGGGDWGGGGDVGGGDFGGGGGDW